MWRRGRGFTLIELLIVVAIIAILSAIAVPNLLEAQTRSKISRVKADLRTIATALEMYRVDNNHYPVDGGRKGDGHLFWYPPGGPSELGSAAGLTSPIAYLTTVTLPDPFSDGGHSMMGEHETWEGDCPEAQFFLRPDFKRYRYRNFRYSYYPPLFTPIQLAFEFPYGEWQLLSYGPDTVPNIESEQPLGAILTVGMNMVYDPTNGTVSKGDIVRSQKYPDQGGPFATGMELFVPPPPCDPPCDLSVE